MCCGPRALRASLRESEQRLTLAASAPGGLVDLDSTSMRCVGDRAGAGHAGLDRMADITPADVLRVVDPADAHDLSDSFRARLKRGGEHAMSFRVVTPEHSRGSRGRGRSSSTRAASRNWCGVSCAEVH
jgi:hypothetical protein